VVFVPKYRPPLLPSSVLCYASPCCDPPGPGTSLSALDLNNLGLVPEENEDEEVSSGPLKKMVFPQTAFIYCKDH
jgi:hypothetical protein